MLHRAATSAYSWWWASHIRTKQSKWLEQSLQDMEDVVAETLNIIHNEGESFTQRAEMYYKKRPQLIGYVEEVYRAYRALAQRYDHISKELQSANRTIATVFPEQVHYGIDEDDGEESFPGTKSSSSSSSQYPINQTPKKGIPKPPDIPKNFRKPCPVRKIASSAKSPPISPTSGLTTAEALAAVDKLQKEILALQTEKEFVRSSYEHSYGKYWEIEDKITERQRRVCNFEDEFGINNIIDDNDARALMEATALNSCKETLLMLQEVKTQSSEEAKESYEMIKEAQSKLKILRDWFFSEDKSKRDPESIEEEDVFSLEEEMHECEINEKLEKDSGSSLTLVEMADKIDEVVNKVVTLETAVSSQTGLVKRLVSEAEELQKITLILEEDEEKLIEDSEETRKKLEEVEEKLRTAKILNQRVKSQDNSLQRLFTRASFELEYLSGKINNVKFDEEGENLLLYKNRSASDVELKEESEKPGDDNTETKKHLKTTKEKKKDYRVKLGDVSNEDNKYNLNKSIELMIDDNTETKKHHKTTKEKKKDYRVNLGDVSNEDNKYNLNKSIELMIDDNTETKKHLKTTKEKKKDYRVKLGDVSNEDNKYNLNKSIKLMIDDNTETKKHLKATKEKKKDYSVNLGDVSDEDNKYNLNKSIELMIDDNTETKKHLKTTKEKKKDYRVNLGDVSNADNKYNLNKSIELMIDDNTETKKDLKTTKEKKKDYRVNLGDVSNEDNKYNLNKSIELMIDDNTETKKHLKTTKEKKKDYRVNLGDVSNADNKYNLNKSIELMIDDNTETKKDLKTTKEKKKDYRVNLGDVSNEDNKYNLNKSIELMIDDNTETKKDLKTTKEKKKDYSVNLGDASNEDNKYNLNKSIEKMIEDIPELIPLNKDDFSESKSNLDTESIDQVTGEKDQTNWSQMFASGLDDREKILSEFNSVVKNYEDVKGKLNDAEKKNQDNILELALQIRDLKNTVETKEKEINILQQKLTCSETNPEERPRITLPDYNYTPQEELLGIAPHETEKKDTKNSISNTDSGTDAVSTPNADHHQQCVDKRTKFGILVKVTSNQHNRSRSLSILEKKFRSAINMLLEENLEFWMRFSTSMHQTHKFQDSIEDLKCELRTIRDDNMSNENSNIMQSEIKAIIKHLREIRSELLLWLEHSEILHEELQRRHPSLCTLQDEIARAANPNCASNMAELSGYQAAKFQGEVLNMKQENNKVRNQLQAGVVFVKGLKGQIDKMLQELSKEIGVNNQEQITKQSTNRARIPLKSFLFGVRLRKQRQPVIEGESPTVQRLYSDLGIDEDLD